MSAYDIAKAARNQIEAEHQAAVAHLKRISGTQLVLLADLTDAEIERLL